MQEYKLHPAKGIKLNKAISLTTKKYMTLLQEGFSYFIGDISMLDIKTDLPIVLNSKKQQPDIPQRDQKISLLFSKQNKIKMALINGQLIKLD